MIRTLIIIFYIFLVSFSFSQKKIDISLFDNSTVKHISLTNDIGSYLLFTYNEKESIDTLNSKFEIKVLKSGSNVKVSLDGLDLGLFNSIKLVKRTTDNSFNIKSLTHNSRTRSYWGDVKISSNGTKLKMVNSVDLHQYLEGVVESESGGGQGLEYYKIQATISRTYALSHMDKHKSEGFNLCDAVHCQVYHSRSLRNEKIPKAVAETKNMVIVDSDIELITAAFFSNCGGQTCNSEDVWLSEVSYLKSVKDPFCSDMPHATWSKTINKEDFVAYIKRKNASSLRSNPVDSMNLNFDHSSRRIYYSGEGYRLMLKYMRTNFRLRSTYFKVYDQGDKIQLTGKGFGHGVGLCQEGAMKMANLGYSFLEILRFYYTGVHLIDLEWIDFYRSE